MCRDIADAQAGQSVMSVVCCGHSAKTKIEHMAFQPDGAFLVRPVATTPLTRTSYPLASSGLVKCMHCPSMIKKEFLLQSHQASSSTCNAPE